MSLYVRRKQFALQSYFDDSLKNQAIIQCSANDPIINTTKEQVSMRGAKMIALSPASETPVAVNLITGRTGGGEIEGASSAVTLIPGQAVRAVRELQGFEWGLPFGWLGGGIAELLVSTDPNVHLGWTPTAPEVLFHRTRMAITADENPSDAEAATANWPLRFPWSNAVSAAGNNQAGLPIIRLNQTRVVMRLNDSLTADATMRIIWAGLDDLDIGSDGLTPDLTVFTFRDVVWPGNGGATSDPFPVISLESGPEMQLGGDTCVVSLLDLTGGSALVNKTVDICRYGTLGG